MEKHHIEKTFPKVPLESADSPASARGAFVTLNSSITIQAHDFSGFRVWEVCPQEWSKKAQRACVFFSHAAGICSGTYLSFLQLWAENSGQRIFAMDCRGFGGSQPLENYENLRGDKITLSNMKAALFGDEVSPVLRQDLFQTFCLVRDMIRRELSSSETVEWTLAGHSLGGWLSLLEAPRCFVQKLVLFDIAILPPKLSLFWTMACLARQRQVHTLAKIARSRKVCYRNKSEAQRVFRRSPMFRGWSETDLDAYLDSHFSQNSSGYELRHDPDWEAAVLESQQPSAAIGFLELSSSIREDLEVKFIVGERSEACTLEASKMVRRMFPRSQWIVLPEAKHMFPFTHKASLMRLLKQAEKGSSASTNEASVPAQFTEPSSHLLSENFIQNKARVA